MNKNNVAIIEKMLSGKEDKLVAMVAPSFVVSFEYPRLIHQLKEIGFDKTVELTFGAKMINREYHKILENSRKMWISSTCPGIVETVKQRYPQYSKNIIRVDSPMVATAKICRKIYPSHKIVFISPCNFKKIEAQNSEYVDYVIDYEQLQQLFDNKKIKGGNAAIHFDKFYNDYTKIFPEAGGLSKTAHVKGILKKGEERIIDGVKEIMDFLNNPDKKIRFLDATFCIGGCINGPHTAKISLEEKKRKLMHYLQIAKEEPIPGHRMGHVEDAKGIRFTT